MLELGEECLTLYRPHTNALHVVIQSLIGDDMIAFNRINAEFTDSLNDTIISTRFFTSLFQLDLPLCNMYGKMMDIAKMPK